MRRGLGCSEETESLHFVFTPHPQPGHRDTMSVSPGIMHMTFSCSRRHQRVAVGEEGHALQQCRLVLGLAAAGGLTHTPTHKQSVSNAFSERMVTCDHRPAAQPTPGHPGDHGQAVMYSRALGWLSVVLDVCQYCCHCQYHSRMDV